MDSNRQRFSSHWFLILISAIVWIGSQSLGAASRKPQQSASTQSTPTTAPKKPQPGEKKNDQPETEEPIGVVEPPDANLSQPKPIEIIPPNDENRGTLEEQFVKGNIAISEWLGSVAEGIDTFLVGKKLTNRANKTSARIESTTFLREYEGAQNSNSFNVNLRLPNVEEYWFLKFTSYDETNERSSTQVGALRRTPREQNVGATLGVFQKLGNIRASFQPRIAFQNPVKVSHNLIFESLADLGTYKINPKLEFFASADDGTGIFTALNFNFKLNDIYSLTLINDTEYRDHIHTYTVTNGVSVGQAITKRSALSYDLIFDSNNRESYNLAAYTAAVTWSEVIYKSILDYSVSPNVVFPRDKDFKAVPGITLNFNLNF